MSYTIKLNSFGLWNIDWALSPFCKLWWVQKGGGWTTVDYCLATVFDHAELFLVLKSEHNCRIRPCMTTHTYDSSHVYHAVMSDVTLRNYCNLSRIWYPPIIMAVRNFKNAMPHAGNKCAYVCAHAPFKYVCACLFTGTKEKSHYSSSLIIANSHSINRLQAFFKEN